MPQKIELWPVAKMNDEQLKEVAGKALDSLMAAAITGNSPISSNQTLAISHLIGNLVKDIDAIRKEQSPPSQNGWRDKRINFLTKSLETIATEFSGRAASYAKKCVNNKIYLPQPPIKGE